MCLGFPPVSGQREEEEEDDVRLMVFSLPTEEMRQRMGVFTWLLLVLFALDFVLVCLVYANAGWAQPASFSDGQMDATTFACTLCEIALGLVAMRGKDTRILTLFVVLYYADALINLLRVYSVLQITHFILQLAICQIMTQYKVTLQPTWFTPSN